MTSSSALCSRKTSGPYSELWCAQMALAFMSSDILVGQSMCSPISAWSDQSQLALEWFEPSICWRND